ncbi:MAG: Type restriction-modification system, specificity subunit [Pedosphaera sp.]|nr:Type restriction-modification system, specificity subunit [Pedosphaera sp.]
MSTNLQTPPPASSSGRPKPKPGKHQSGSGVPPLNPEHKQTQGRSATLSDDSKNGSSKDGMKKTRDLPRGWRWATLPELGELSRGKSKQRPRNDPKLYGGPYPFIQTGDIRESGGKICRHTQTYSEAGLAQSRLWPRGTLCITIAANIGETGILTYPACFPDSVVGFRSEADPITVSFVELYFRIAKHDLERYAPATAQKNINVAILSKLPIPVPPPAEQQRIVAEIEKQFTRLDAGIAALRRVHANLKRYRAAVLKAACEGRLVPTEAELAKTAKRKSKFETGEELLARILIERRKNWQGRGQYKEPAALNTAKLFHLPAGWSWTTLDALAEIKGGVTKDQNRKHTAPARSVPYLRVANVQRGYIDLTEVKEIVTTEEEIQELALKPGDILFNEGGDRDKLGRGWIWNGELPECIHQNHVFRARLYVAALNPKLISWYANTFGQKFFFDEGKHTTNLASISMSKLKGLPVPIPPPAEQTRIVAEVERRLSVVEELESAVTVNRQRAIRLRQSILHKAFTGELTA